MTTRKIWNGKGEIEPGAAYWEISRGWKKGQLVGRDYVRRRVVAHLARYMSEKTAAERAAIVAATVDNDEWLAWRNGMLVGAVCWDAWRAFFTDDIEVNS